jgi:hypothetical protein
MGQIKVERNALDLMMTRKLLTESRNEGMM